MVKDPFISRMRFLSKKAFSCFLLLQVMVLALFCTQHRMVMVVASTTEVVKSIGSIGAIIDNTTRAGKEARVAIEMAIHDFNTKNHQNLLLFSTISPGKPFQAALQARDLIDTHKVEAILGQNTLEEVVSIAEVGGEAQIPTFSLVDSTPQWAIDRCPFLIQASPSQHAQMKGVAAILQSWGWRRLTFIYEDINSASTVIPHLLDAIREVGADISNILELSPFASSSLEEDLERLKREQCRVFVVHTSSALGNRLFQNAKRMGMMEKEYVWIATNLITDSIHSLSSSTIYSMQGVVGLGSFFHDTGSQFQDFNTRFRKKFKMELPEEEASMPGITAVRAYDATWAVALALSRRNMSGHKLFERISKISFNGLTGEVQFIDRKLAASHTFQIVNVIGNSYRHLGFWSERLKFSKAIDEWSTHNTSMQNLWRVFWPGEPFYTPRGWALPTSAHPLRVGVPSEAQFKQFVEVGYHLEDGNYTYTGYSIELFKETVKHLPYYLPYEFSIYNGTYDSLVQQVYLKNFDAVVGDVSVVAARYQYAEFTHPYTETGLVMLVPVESNHKPWLFVKPFTIRMWAFTVAVNIYNGFVVWLIERNHSTELQGSALNQTGTLLWLAFTRLFASNGDALHSNLSRTAMLVWLFVAVIITQSYTASLTSMLTVRRLTPKVANFQTLRNENAIVGYSRGAFVAKYLEEVLGFNPNNIKSFSSPEEYAQALRNGKIAAFFIEVPLSKLFLAKYCKSFIVAGPTFEVGGFAFVLPKGSPMVADLTVALLNVSESGKIQDLKNKWIGSEKCVDTESSYGDNDSLGLDSFWGLFLLTGATSTIALAIYAIIGLWKRYNNVNERRSLITVIEGVIKHLVHQRRLLSRKVSDAESPRCPPSTRELTLV